MDKTAIKNFAVWARVKLMEDMRTRLGLLGIMENGISDPLPASTNEVKYFDIGADHPVSLKGKAIHQREQLAEKIRKAGKESNYQSAYRSFIESFAYDWFNRLIAIRYMEVNEYAPLDVRLLSSVEPGKQDPDLVSTPFDGSLEYSESETQQILAWKEQHDNNKLFRFLLFKMCNQLHEVLPGIFEARDDASELLMRQSFIDKDGIIHHLVNDIPEEDWKDQVQIIGWIYQYYNSELKAEVFAKKEKVTKDELPAVTQLFTPDWIVRYMVENSLGRLWIEHLRGLDPDVDEKEVAEKFGWKYYLPEAKQEPEVEQQLAKIREEYAALKPEDLSCLDPCMGSGHILVYMFDVLEQIYTSVGYSEREAAKAILENNIYGLDIDDRAYQLAYFAVMMKARQYNRRILTSGIKAHVYSIQESNYVNRDVLDYFVNGDPKLKKAMENIISELHDAKEYGSILNVTIQDFPGLYARFDVIRSEVNLWKDAALTELLPLVQCAQVLAEKYQVVVTNPPYMGSSGMSEKLGVFIKKNYPNSKNDLFSCFIERGFSMLIINGFESMITMESWMFLSSFEKLRSIIVNSKYIVDLVHMPYLGKGGTSLGINFGTDMAVIRNANIKDYKGTYDRIAYYETNDDGIPFEFPTKNSYYKHVSQFNFSKIPGGPVAYWVSAKFLKTFDSDKLSKFADTTNGFTTGDNNKFLRLWFEVEFSNIGFHEKSVETAKHSQQKWFPYNKGGDFRKWYGNNDYVINWGNDGREIKAYGHLVPRSLKYMFHESVTWNKITSGFNAFRYKAKGTMFDVAGLSLFPYDDNDLLYLMALCNSIYTRKVLQTISPTLNCETGHVASIPVKKDDRSSKIVELTKSNISLSKSDWDSFETSWDFRRNPLLRDDYTIKEAFSEWKQECDDRFHQLKTNEEELNQIFIDIYNLQDELKPEEGDQDVTVRKADLGRDIRSLISYAIGCMFGRYSLDKEGLIYAGGNFDSIFWKFKGQAPLSEDGEIPIGGGYAGISLAPYHYPKFRDSVDYEKATTLSFEPDTDNVIPITDQKYLDDDVVERICEFLTVVYGADTLEENLDFIAKALGNKGLTSREVIRNYMLNDFFKDHCKIYSVTGSGKRPIYWLFDSGKENAFKALVYMHRWDADTTGRVLIYAQQIQQKYETEIRAIDMMLDHITDARQKSTEEKRQEHLKKQLEELVNYEERLEHMANERIAIDLDDGVKVNYEKVQTDRNGKKYQILASIK